jgi:hypothetical protein
MTTIAPIKKTAQNTTNKSESGYEENKEGYSCKRCEYFNGKNKCEKLPFLII